MIRRSPASDKARLFLENILANQSPQQGAKLPSLRQLGVLADVSLLTMRKAVLSMQRQGKLYCKSGSGIYIGPAPDHRIAPAVAIRTARWEALISKMLAYINDPIPRSRIDSFLHALGRSHHPHWGDTCPQEFGGNIPKTQLSCLDLHHLCWPL